MSSDFSYTEILFYANEIFQIFLCCYFYITKVTYLFTPHFNRNIRAPAHSCNYLKDQEIFKCTP